MKIHLLLIGVCMASLLQAAEYSAVNHAQTSVINGHYFLNADITYSLHSEAQEMLDRGLAIKIQLQVELFEQKKYWRKKSIATVHKNYLLQRNPLTERFVISVPDEKTRYTFATPQEAVASLRHLEGIALVEEIKVAESEKVQARARLVVDVRHFSEPLRYLAKYWDDWRLVSEWYVWPLKL